MRLLPTALLSIAVLAIAEPALAQQANYNVSWAALNPRQRLGRAGPAISLPDRWRGSAPSTGNEATVIGQIVGQFTGFVAAIACAFVIYNTIMSIHRAAETSRILGSRQDLDVRRPRRLRRHHDVPARRRLLRRPGLVLQSAMWGIGMAKVLYTNAIQAVGPDAVVIAQPDDARNRATSLGPDRQRALHGPRQPGLANTGGHARAARPADDGHQRRAAAATPPGDYALSVGNESGTPACGTVTVQTPASNRDDDRRPAVSIWQLSSKPYSTTFSMAPSGAQVAAGRAEPLAEQDSRLARAASGHLHQRQSTPTRSELTTAATSVQSAINAPYRARRPRPATAISTC